MSKQSYRRYIGNELRFKQATLQPLPAVLMLSATLRNFFSTSFNRPSRRPMAAFILQSVHWAPTWTTVKRPAVPLWTSLHNGPAMVRQSGVPWSSFTHQKLDVLCTVQRRVHWASSGAHGVRLT
ncbi:hypothetical protein PCANC_21228 [Puccinia coronata f. sp. avenae]|uniref:Uncharacterized protein n=1 Tax=Puccinia coronata f. sp. avenae TaxID=200324 RepID=A0A2N5TKZ4_9BASI|nr:hypothetical protein PCANC_21228 [Puccinia coronata f. sp. avenae]